MEDFERHSEYTPPGFWGLTQAHDEDAEERNEDEATYVDYGNNH